MAPALKNRLYFGDNLKILRERIADESVDLVYLDPPFNSNANYNVLFKEKSGEESAAPIRAFDDTWHWTMESASVYQDLVTDGPKKLADLLQALLSFLGRNDMMAYLVMMAARLVELRRVLKPTGSIYLHCDPTASHYLKLVLDAVFGLDNFRSEIIWKRTSSHNSAKRWGPVHDVLLFYSKTSNYKWSRVYQPYDEAYLKAFYRHKDEKGVFRLGDLTGAGTRTGESGQPWRGVDPTAAGRHWAVPAIPDVPEIELVGMSVEAKLNTLDDMGLIYWPQKGSVPQFRRYLDLDRGVPAQDVITDVDPLSPHAKEKLDYPTQKPEALLQRIIRASSDEGDVVLDPFCGCGTAIAASEQLRRRWIGIDVTYLAINLVQRRLKEAFKDALDAYEIIGAPQDVASAVRLKEIDPYQFEWWAVDLVNARPGQDKKKGSDSGVDGYITFFDDKSGQAKRLIVQVKSGRTGVHHVRDLKGTMEREKAAMGALIILEEPTKPMRQEAAAAGLYSPPELGGKYPKLQIRTIAELLDGKELVLPEGIGNVTFQNAQKKTKSQQKRLF